MTTSEFFDECVRTDWFYEYSDDHSKWRRGEERMSRLKNLAKDNPEFQKILEAWWAYEYTEKDKRPAKPNKEDFSIN